MHENWQKLVTKFYTGHTTHGHCPHLSYSSKVMSSEKKWETRLVISSPHTHVLSINTTQIVVLSINTTRIVVNYNLPAVSKLGKLLSCPMLTPDVLKTSSKIVTSVMDFPTWNNVMRFLSLCSHHWWFISASAKPLNAQKNVAFSWSEHCQLSCSQLKQCLAIAPVLALDKAFNCGMWRLMPAYGAVLSQFQRWTL